MYLISSLQKDFIVDKSQIFCGSVFGVDTLEFCFQITSRQKGVRKHFEQRNLLFPKPYHFREADIEASAHDKLNLSQMTKSLQTTISNLMKMAESVPNG